MRYEIVMDAANNGMMHVGWLSRGRKDKSTVWNVVVGDWEQTFDSMDKAIRTVRENMAREILLRPVSE